MKRLLLLLLLGAFASVGIAHGQQYQESDTSKVQVYPVRTLDSLRVSSECDSTALDNLENSVDPEMVVCPDSSLMADMPQVRPEGRIDPDMVIDPREERSSLEGEEVRVLTRDSTKHEQNRKKESKTETATTTGRN